ncbi:MAG: hypothetical protein LBN26_09990 [Christensenellaceae bacterium]|jgi:hypothetical protein|nr:hypothetical protein [Christensenellaceae bacterium]
MKRIKEHFFILLAIVVVITLAACAPGDSKRTTADGELSSSPATNTPVVKPPTPAITQTPLPSPEPTPEAEKPFFMANEYKVYYEIVPQAAYEQVVGDLAQYVDNNGVNMDKDRVFYIRYTGAEEDGQEVKMSSIWRNISWSKLVFSVGGTDYKQPSILMSTGTQVYITYLFVPNNTPDNVSVSIRYAE